MGRCPAWSHFKRGNVRFPHVNFGQAGESVETSHELPFVGNLGTGDEIDKGRSRWETRDKRASGKLILKENENVRWTISMGMRAYLRSTKLTDKI